MAYSARPTSTNELTQLVHQVAHGFAVGQLVTFSNASSKFVLAEANSLANSAGVGIVSILVDVNDFYITQTGWVNNIPGPLTLGAQYYLSQSSPGALTLSVPANGTVGLPCFVADTTTSGYFYGGSGITIGGSGGSSFTWSSISAGQTLVAAHGYFVNAGGSINLALPASAAVGDTYEIWDTTGNGFTVTQNAGQSILVGKNSSTVGVTGSIVSTQKGNLITIVCSTANTGFNADPGLASFTVN